MRTRLSRTLCAALVLLSSLLPAATQAQSETVCARPAIVEAGDTLTGLAAAWLDDGAAETAAMRLAVRDNQGWREVGRIATRESTAAAAFMHARRLGRPILWAEGGWLHLWYEAYPLGPGAGASIMHSVSTDGGRSWQRTRRLESGPFGGLGSRLGDIPRPLADGGVLLPLEEDGREGPWLRLAATGHLVGQPRQLPSAAPAP